MEQNDECSHPEKEAEVTRPPEKDEIKIYVGQEVEMSHPVKIFVVIRPMKADIRRMQAGQYSDSHSNHIYSAR